ncbi:hypothetical protein MMC14_003331 [Varicellaria rhodocarpa]|nr:hypothetical protein [Varicellaria rhodocarpa]
MAATPANFDRKPATGIRPGLAQVQASEAPSSPHTPQRTIPSTFSSPASSYRTEEDSLVFDFGSRYFRAGYAGESAPRCTLGFGPRESRRAGDYREWLPDYGSRPRKKRRCKDWGKEHELWRMDLRDLDLGLIEDKIERAVRDTYNRYLLLDSKSRRILLVLPSLMPHPLLSTILSTLFNNFLVPSITLLSTPVMAMVAAGLRSSLVVDIGWHETIVTGVYEYREIHQSRTTCAMKLVVREMAKSLQHRATAQGQQKVEEGEPLIAAEDEILEVEFEHAEEVTMRLAWCQRLIEAIPNQNLKGRSNDPPHIESARDHDQEDHQSWKQDTLTSMPLLSSSSQSSQVPFSTFCCPVDKALLASPESSYELDDHEYSVPFLIYKVLLSMPPDIRGVCMSRIIITGGGSRIPGIKSRLLDEVSALVEERGWDPVRGKAADELQKRMKELRLSRQQTTATKLGLPVKSTEILNDLPKVELFPIAAGFVPQVPDPIEDKIRREEAKGKKPTVSGVIRGVETLGAWTGASLIGGLKIKGIVEIERETFLQHGLSGAKRDSDASVVQQRQSFGPGVPRAGGMEKIAWTLGGWA